MAHITVSNAGSFDSLKNSATEREFILEYNFILQYLLCIPAVISPAIIPPNIPICSDCIPSMTLCPAISIAYGFSGVSATNETPGIIVVDKRPLIV